MISYKPLLDYFYENEIKKTDLNKELNISTKTIAKLDKGEYISLATIEAICLHYGLPIEQVVRITNN